MAHDRLEDRFDFLAPADIRIKGHRIGIEHVLYHYIYEGWTPKQIHEHFDTLTLEDVLATIEYYLDNRDEVGRYVASVLEWGRERRAEQAADRSLDSLRERMADVRATRLLNT